MRYLIVSDIHANLTALDAVLADCEGLWDAALCLGDIVGYGPEPNECVSRVQELPEMLAVIGNHDVAALGRIDINDFNPLAREAALWTQDRLTSESRSMLDGLPEIEEDGLWTIVHGSPRDPVWEYLDQEADVTENFARFTTHLCFVGHTHVPRTFTQNPDSKAYEIATHVAGDVVDTAANFRRILNPGSVGQPRDGDPRAAYALFDTNGAEFQFRRVEYAIATTQKAMADVGLPRPLADRLSYGF